MRCKNCGTESDERNLNCSNCGAEFTAEECTKELTDLLKNKKFLGISACVLSLVIIVLLIVVDSVIIPNQAAENMRYAFESKSGEKVLSVFTDYCGDYSVVYDDLSKSGKKVFIEFKNCVSDLKDDLNSQPAETDINNYLLNSTGDIVLPKEYSAITTIGQYNIELNSVVVNYYELYLSRIAYEEGNKLYNSGNFGAAVNSFLRVIEYDYLYDDAQNKLAESQTKMLEEKIVLIEKYIRNGEYEAAQQQIFDLREDSITDEMKKKLDEYETKIYEARLSKIDELIDNGDFEGANKYIESLGEGLSVDAKARLEQAIKNKANDYIKNADEAFKRGERQGAYDMAKMAQNICPDDENINKRVAYFEQYLPFELYKSKNCLSKQNKFFYDCKVTANDSSNMINCMYVVYDIYNSSDFLGEATYNLAKKYDKVIGTGFLVSGWHSYEQNGYFEMYGDGKKIYTSSKFKVNYLPKDFSVDVTGVSTLTVKYYGVTNEVGAYGISNFVATKNLP